MKFGDYKGIILYMQKDRFSPEQIRAWEEHYGIKLKRLYATDTRQYVLTRQECELGKKSLGGYKTCEALS